jgi:hypothetical protein
MDLFSPMLNAGPAPSDEAKARAVKASVETLLEVLPKDLSGVTLEAAAKAVAASPDEPEADRALPAPANVDDDEE